jgi:hypothetical protein
MFPADFFEITENVLIFAIYFLQKDKIWVISNGI